MATRIGAHSLPVADIGAFLGKVPQGSGSVSLGSVTASGAVTRTANLSLSITLSEVTASGTVVQTLQPSGSVTLGLPTTTGSADKLGYANASGSTTLGSPTVTGSITRTLSSSGSVTLSSTVSSGIAQKIGNKGTIAALRLGAHGPVMADLGAFSKATPSKGTLVNLPGRLGPHMSILTNLDSNDDVLLTLTGVQMTGEVNAVVGISALTRNQLRADVLPASTRDFTTKGLANVIQTLTGAAMRGQGEQLEGATTSIITDGSRMSSIGSVSTGDATETQPGATRILFGFRARWLSFSARTAEGRIVFS